MEKDASDAIKPTNIAKSVPKLPLTKLIELEEPGVCKVTSLAIKSYTADRVFNILIKSIGMQEDLNIGIKEFLSKDVSEYSLEEMYFFMNFFFSNKLGSVYTELINKINSYIKLRDNVNQLDSDRFDYSIDNISHPLNDIVSIEAIRKELYPKLVQTYYRLLQENPDFVADIFKNYVPKNSKKSIQARGINIPLIKEFDGIGFIVLEIEPYCSDPDSKIIISGKAKNEDGNWIPFERIGNNYTAVEIKGVQIINTLKLEINKKTGKIVSGKILDENGKKVKFKKDKEGNFTEKKRFFGRAKK